VVRLQPEARRGARLSDQHLEALDHRRPRLGGIVTIGTEIRRQLGAERARVEVGRGVLDRFIHAARRCEVSNNLAAAGQLPKPAYAPPCRSAFSR
jgi:hypothetical protein